jgi:hypothetical protein
MAWERHKRRALHDERFRISAIVQTGSEKEALKTAYLAELLHLSADTFTPLYGFDCRKAEEQLLTSPLISSAKVKRLPPRAIYVEYEVRKPVALLSDYKNVALDREGYLFPFHPFFAPKELPEVYLGLPSFGAPEDSMGRSGGHWHTPLSNRYLHLALELLQVLEGSAWREGFRCKRIDVSNAFAPTLGQRELVLYTEEELFVKDKERPICCTFPKILRLAPKDYTKQLQNFFTLRRKMAEDYGRQVAASGHEGRFAPRIIDLRIPQLAFVENTTP